MNEKSPKPRLLLDDIQPTKNPTGGAVKKTTSSGGSLSKPLPRKGTATESTISSSKGKGLFEGCYKYE